MSHKFFGAIAIAAPLALIVACSGTSIRPGSDTGSTDPTADGGHGGGTSGGDAATGGGGGGGDGSCTPACAEGSVCTNGTCTVLPSMCPCPTGSYCDLSTNSCKVGCTDASQCPAGATCDTSTRTCQKPKPALAGCPIPAGTAVDGGVGTCNGVTPLGKDVAQVCKAGTMPVAHGGVVKDGIYVLVATDYFGASCSAASFAATVYVCGNTWGVSEGAQVASAAVTTRSVTFTGTSFTQATTCGGSGNTTSPYDATDTALTIYTADGTGGGFVDHYARQ